MNCPVCKDVNLVMTDRQSIELDYCPQCRGVWLDRGELDKLIERSASQQRTPSNRSDSPHERPHSNSRDEYYYKKKKRKSLLGELFDF